MEGSLSDSSQLPPPPRASWEQGQRGEAGGDLAGKERRLCFQSWLSRAGAGEHTVPIRNLVLCCMCFHGFLGGGVGRGDSCRSCNRQGLIRGDPSLVLTCMVGHPHTPHPSTLSVGWMGVWWPMSSCGFPCGDAWEVLGRVMAMPSGHPSDGRGQGRPAPDQALDDQSPLGRWLEHGRGPWVGGGEDRAIQAAVAPGWRVQAEFQEGVGLCGWREPREVGCRAECRAGGGEGKV